MRNNLGLKQTDDWIYNLNIGNVMHLSLMGTDELSDLDRKDAQLDPLSKSTNTMNSSLDQRTGSKAGSSSDQNMSPFEISHELCKDAMLEKIVLISVAYFCIATEMRFIMQKQKQ